MSSCTWSAWAACRRQVQASLSFHAHIQYDKSNCQLLEELGLRAPHLRNKKSHLTQHFQILMRLALLGIPVLLKQFSANCTPWGDVIVTSSKKAGVLLLAATMQAEHVLKLFTVIHGARKAMSFCCFLRPASVRLGHPTSSNKTSLNTHLDLD